MKLIDIRSDTVALPTEEMYAAIREADIGDDVFWDDPTVVRLEEMAAERLGKEAALFVPTGTMGNTVAILTHTIAGEEIVAGAYSHIVRHELGAAARLAGVSYALADNPDTFVYPEDVKRLILPPDFFNSRTGLICLENALFNGDVVPIDILFGAYREANIRGVPVHLDGARIFNAAVALGVDASEIAACSDSVMFCISKGLCAPAGSLLCGEKDFIEKARKNRKLLGGGMRQAGILAACGIVGLEKMTDRLAEDHANARHLAEQMAAIPHIFTQPDKVKINIMHWHTDLPNFDSDHFVAHMRAANIKVLGIMDGEYRFVTNNNVDWEDLDRVVREVAAFVSSLS